MPLLLGGPEQHDAMAVRILMSGGAGPKKLSAFDGIKSGTFVYSCVFSGKPLRTIPAAH